MKAPDLKDYLVNFYKDPSHEHMVIPGMVYLSYPTEYGTLYTKKELTDILDRLQQAKINTVLIQTRVRGTMIYPSAYEPWDGCLSGFPGRSPGYDALKFAIDECHKRGM